MNAKRLALAAVFGLALMISGSGLFTPSSNANGGAAFSLQNFRFTWRADADLDYTSRWRITICTTAPARVRIRAILDSIDFGRESHRFVRRQGRAAKRTDCTRTGRTGRDRPIHGCVLRGATCDGGRRG